MDRVIVLGGVMRIERCVWEISTGGSLDHIIGREYVCALSIAACTSFLFSFFFYLFVIILLIEFII